MAQVPEGVLLGVGSLILDLHATVDKAFLEKWDLKENDAIMCDVRRVKLFHELMENYDVEYVPGGAGHNVMRICQWILNVPFRTVFFGSIGRDPLGELLVEKARAAGIDVQYQVHDSLPTGRCAVLVYGEHRSLCSNPAAASSFVLEHVQLPRYQQAIHKALYYYIVGFFLNVCPATVMHIAEHSHEHKKTFSFNLSAPYVCHKFPDFLLKLLPYVDILFGNEAEAVAFAKAARFETTDLREIVTKIATYEKRSDKVRLVVITRSESPIMVAEGGRIEEIAVYPTQKEKIVDTNGAGDAFVGGFLSQYIQCLGLRLSVECGNYAAAEVIQRHGCTVPEKCRYH